MSSGDMALGRALHLRSSGSSCSKMTSNGSRSAPAFFVVCRGGIRELEGEAAAVDAIDLGLLPLRRSCEVKKLGGGET